MAQYGEKHVDAYDNKAYDMEYNAAGEKHRSSIIPDETGAVPGETFLRGDSTYAKIQRAVSRYGVEARGIERVPDDERTDKSTMKVGTMVQCANFRIQIMC
jgi:hypothetical protein